MEVLHQYLHPNLIVIVNGYLSVFDHIRLGQDAIISSRVPKKRMRFRGTTSPTIQETDRLGALIYSLKRLKGFDHRNYIHFCAEMRAVILMYSSSHDRTNFISTEYETFGCDVFSAIIRDNTIEDDTTPMHVLKFAIRRKLDDVITLALPKVHIDLIPGLVLQAIASGYRSLSVDLLNRLPLEQRRSVNTASISTAITYGNEDLAIELIQISQAEVDWTEYMKHLNTMISHRMTRLIPSVLSVMTPGCRKPSCEIDQAIISMPELIPTLISLNLYVPNYHMIYTMCRHKLPLHYCKLIIAVCPKNRAAYTNIITIVKQENYPELEAYMWEELSKLPA